MREILRAVVFLHRVIDDRDFTTTINCIPDDRMKILEDGLKQRQANGEVDTVQIGRHRFEAAARTPYIDQIDKFFELIDSVKLKEQYEQS